MSIKVLCADLALKMPAFVVFVQQDEKVKVEDVLLVDNRKLSGKPHGKIQANIEKEFLKLLNKHNKSERKIDVFVREPGIGTYCHSTTMTQSKVVGVTDLLLWKKCKQAWRQSLFPTSIKLLQAGSGRASKEEVAVEVRKYLHEQIEFESNDVSDALAAGISWQIGEGLIKNKLVKKADKEKNAKKKKAHSNGKGNKGNEGNQLNGKDSG